MTASEEVKNAIAKIADIMAENFALLSRLDAEMGDGDLGVYMKNGFAQAYEDIRCMDGTPGELLKKAGSTMMDQAPSTLGTLMGVFIRRMGRSLGNAPEITLASFTAALGDGIGEIEKRGGAKRGDKTILDTLWPAYDALKGAEDAGETSLKAALAEAYAASRQGLEHSNGLKAVFGRPAYFGEKTIGMQDGGATVGMLIFMALNQINP